jgi:Spy/CpxP family protein refolding chaperone
MIRTMRDFGMAVALVALVAARSRAQQASCEHCRGVMAPPALVLLAQPSVQQELKLSDEQIKKVGDAVAQDREEFRKIRELPRDQREPKFAELFETSRKQTRAIVTPEQAHRLRQIVWQQEGGLAFCHPHVAKELQLSAEQKEKIKAIQKETREALKNYWMENAPQNRAQVFSKRKELHDDAAAKMMALITPEQKAKWQEMIGEPFTGAISCHGPCAQ